jgi:hypothetical protein
MVACATLPMAMPSLVDISRFSTNWIRGATFLAAGCGLRTCQLD